MSLVISYVGWGACVMFTADIKECCCRVYLYIEFLLTIVQLSTCCSKAEHDALNPPFNTLARGAAGHAVLITPLFAGDSHPMPAHAGHSSAPA